jgi:hypothetical protein
MELFSQKGRVFIAEIEPLPDLIYSGKGPWLAIEDPPLRLPVMKIHPN